MAPRFQFDTGFDRRRLVIIVGGVLVILAAVGGILLLTRGGDETEEAAEPVSSATPTLSPTPSPSPNMPPTDTPTPGPTATLEPYEHIVQAEETLYFIIQLYGYRDLAVVPEILVLNGMVDENDLVEGQRLLIPRQTPTPGPSPSPRPTLAEGEAAAPPEGGAPEDYAGCSPETRCITPDGQYWVHEVREGDTLAQIAYEYDSTIQCLLDANGITRDTPIFPGQQLYVCILVTLTPTLTPTGGPDSTATPTPTPAPPSLLAPANGATIPRNRLVVLQWAAARPLMGDQHYLVVVRNLTQDDERRVTTRDTVFRLPNAWQPGLGQSAQFEWQVVIVGSDNPDAPPVSGPGVVWTFTWG